LEFPAPVFHEDIHAGQLFLDLFRVSAISVNFIDRENHRQTGGLCMGDGFSRLRHHGVIGGDDDHCHVGGFGTAGAHGGEGFVTGCIEEGDPFTGSGRHLVGADMLVIPPASPATTLALRI